MDLLLYHRPLASFDFCAPVQMLEWINVGFTSVFALEAVLKIIGLGWSNYWRPVWNKFDLFLVFTSLLDVIVSVMSVNFLRVLRLLRLLKVMKMAKSLKVGRVALPVPAATALVPVPRLAPDIAHRRCWPA